ncbi:phosphate ABC transporter, periplasmic phosphate-binding protein [Candidatus Endolissoclinum faulkneri L2]|uniref:Phosphate ABC transporter, periplasmic phosphate-binding protein n=1 Tax=Candidatus Endolissoclinum faulkneri L2 TaxID=1193729 RepID=K7YRR6_9PROT|nr:substrate-binding domain-containing protein [Candidatus Endolissoclinum faulkneri]AFX99244.1 phosphate ABC transporter, periplasmic phosphate-binding protein [Candidatus Endolissoclinum faulkneri L2]
MSLSFTKLAIIIGLFFIAMTARVEARDQIRIVGSSTVFPFAALVAENFGKRTDFRTPVIESTGSGAGIKLFCQGIGVKYPDITNSSREIKKTEVALCAKNGVREITEIKIGFDGIILANSKQAKIFNLSYKDIFLALAKKIPFNGKLVANPYTKWSQINAYLPDIKIEVLGPAPTSGTRDAFVEQVMKTGAKKLEFLNKLSNYDQSKFKQIFASMREDGKFIEVGENDNLIIQKLESNPSAIGIFGFSFLEQNTDKIHGSLIEGIPPTFDSIANGSYPIARSLFLYIKNHHIDLIPGIKEYVAEFISDEAVGEEGYLTINGLIPLPELERNQVLDRWFKIIDSSIYSVES